MGHGTKAISVFFPADGKTSWLPLPSLFSLLISGCTVQPENTYFFHSLQRGKHHPFSPINKPTLPPLWLSLPSLKIEERKRLLAEFLHFFLVYRPYLNISFQKRDKSGESLAQCIKLNIHVHIELRLIPVVITIEIFLFVM